jgi:hypothetical protein
MSHNTFTVFHLLFQRVLLAVSYITCFPTKSLRDYVSRSQLNSELCQSRSCAFQHPVLVITEQWIYFIIEPCLPLFSSTSNNRINLLSNLVSLNLRFQPPVLVNVEQPKPTHTHIARLSQSLSCIIICIAKSRQFFSFFLLGLGDRASEGGPYRGRYRRSMTKVSGSMTEEIGPLIEELINYSLQHSNGDLQLLAPLSCASVTALFMHATFSNFCPRIFTMFYTNSLRPWTSDLIHIHQVLGSSQELDHREGHTVMNAIPNAMNAIPNSVSIRKPGTAVSDNDHVNQSIFSLVI